MNTGSKSVKEAATYTSLCFKKLKRGQAVGVQVAAETMQWRRRHCCSHTAKFLYLLLVTGLLVFLVDQVWVSKQTRRPWWRGHPVAYGGGELHTTKSKGNMSALKTALRSDTGPQQTDPQQTDPQSTDQQSTDPQSTEPQPTDPQSTEPQPTDPQSTEPQPTDPQPIEPQQTEPQQTDPQQTDPQQTDPQQTSKTDATINTLEKEAVSSPQGDQGLDILAAKTTQSVEDDVSVAISPGPFNYIINEPDKCPDSRPAPFLVLLITTEARQVEARNAIRQTWGNKSVAPALGFIRLFLLGKKRGEVEDSRQKMLEEESRRYHDIIQQDFLDTYNNLTIKTLMGLNWVAVHCPQAAYVMKTNSDMFVNTEYLIYKLLKPELKPKKDFFTGHKMGFLRNSNKNSKWYMPPELYPGQKYPTFYSGTGYVFSGDLARKIYHASLRIPHQHLEDVYVGICLAKLQIKTTPPPSELLFNEWRVPYSSCQYSQLITSHGIRPNEILEYWHHLKSNPCIESRQGA